jgi:hypothetical protein
MVMEPIDNGFTANIELVGQVFYASLAGVGVSDVCQTKKLLLVIREEHPRFLMVVIVICVLRT